MNQKATPRAEPAETPRAEHKPFEAPKVRRESRLPVVTAGSFDLVIPNAP